MVPVVQPDVEPVLPVVPVVAVLGRGLVGGGLGGFQPEVVPVHPEVFPVLPEVVPVLPEVLPVLPEVPVVAVEGAGLVAAIPVDPV